MDPKTKKIIIAAVVVVLLIAGFFVMRLRSSNNGSTDGQIEDVLPEIEALPTVGPGVKVSLEADALKREVVLSIDGIPTGTNSIEYELSYVADGDLPKGVIGTIVLKPSDKSVEREITLGTCSSGACVYDKGVDSIHVSLKFQSDAGDSIYENDFEI